MVPWLPPRELFTTEIATSRRDNSHSSHHGSMTTPTLLSSTTTFPATKDQDGQRSQSQCLLTGQVTEEY
ncbi:hypothetical protein I79_009008 [Cricetulus griseus]|uniref:Uncharacterized protein n=1 Tax=Cricetulus griseus TaxID=10029 RepID=G3HEM1_CRIGR|nr:hypothetical protein I79_009008 [Cricetulus griseus]